MFDPKRSRSSIRKIPSSAPLAVRYDRCQSRCLQIMAMPSQGGLDALLFAASRSKSCSGGEESESSRKNSVAFETSGVAARQ